MAVISKEVRGTVSYRYIVYVDVVVTEGQVADRSNHCQTVWMVPVHNTYSYTLAPTPHSVPSVFISFMCRKEFHYYFCTQLLLVKVFLVYVFFGSSCCCWPYMVLYLHCACMRGCLVLYFAVVQSGMM